MTTIIITALILIILTLKVIQQAIWINDQKISDDWEDTDEACCYHISKEYCDGDCCRCPECTDRYHKEIIK